MGEETTTVLLNKKGKTSSPGSKRQAELVSLQLNPFAPQSRWFPLCHLLEISPDHDLFEVNISTFWECVSTTESCAVSTIRECVVRL